MPRFSVAISDELFARLEAARATVAKRRSGYWSSWAKPWSRDATAAYLIGLGLDRLEQMNQSPRGADLGNLNQLVDDER